MLKRKVDRAKERDNILLIYRSSIFWSNWCV